MVLAHGRLVSDQCDATAHEAQRAGGPSMPNPSLGKKSMVCVAVGRSIAKLVVCLFFSADACLASGSLPPAPFTAGPFQSFTACLDYLEALHQDQTRLAMEAPVKLPKGEIQQILLSTQGISRGAGEQASYDAELGFQIRTADQNQQFIVTEYSWERYSLSCRGAVFKGTVQDGYDLPGTEPIAK